MAPAPTSPPRWGDRVELFRLDDDPTEQADLADREPERVARLLALLEQMAEMDE